MQQTSKPGGSALKARTFGSMGTVISLTVPAGAVPATAGGDRELDAATAAVERVFADSDETFSLYRPIPRPACWRAASCPSGTHPPGCGTATPMPWAGGS